MVQRPILCLCLAAALLLVCSAPAHGQTEGNATVDLRLNPDYEQGPSVSTVDVSTSSDSSKRMGTAPGDVLVSAERVPEASDAFLLKVDADRDRSLQDEKEHLLRLDSTVTVKVKRSWPSAESRVLPYSVTYSGEYFHWRPHYRAEGTLQFGECENFIGMLDLDGNGTFDQQDFSRGTTVQIDRNNDGKVWGRGEYLRGSQIIEYCGESFLLADVAPNGTSVTLVRTETPVPEVGEPIPSFTAETTDGQTLSAEGLEGQSYLLDFWASWCAPCVGKFSKLQTLEEELDEEFQIIAVNVDERSALDQARNAIERYDLTWPHVMRGEGDADPLWKMFGSMGSTRLSIPLYVLVDQEGVVRYAGSGGPDLGELTNELKSMLNANR